MIDYETIYYTIVLVSLCLVLGVYCVNGRPNFDDSGLFVINVFDTLYLTFSME